MPRKRIIDPEFWSDEEIGQWSYEARLFYIGLWNFSDDVGRFKAHHQLLKSQIFPYDQKFNIENLKKELNHKVQWYEVSGLQYGYLRNFNKHQRIDKPSDSKLPPPPPFYEHSTNVLGTLPPNISKDKLSKEKRIEVTHPPFVIMTKEEHEKLVSSYGVALIAKYIEDLNLYAAQKPNKFKEYASHYATVQAWMRRDNVKKRVSPVIAPTQVSAPFVQPTAEDRAKLSALTGKIGISNETRGM